MNRELRAKLNERSRIARGEHDDDITAMNAAISGTQLAAITPIIVLQDTATNDLVRARAIVQALSVIDNEYNRSTYSGILTMLDAALTRLERVTVL